MQTHDISVVVQGPVVGTARDGDREGSTKRCLSLVRCLLPGAEIVLSTWKGSDVSGLPHDVLVENVDPGAVAFDDYPSTFNNVNRQIVTTKSGLKAATRPYALKLRSDMEMRHLGFMSYFGRFPERCNWSVLHSKVIASTLYARVPGLLYDWPYHPGDWFFFGATEDVRDIWEIPLAVEPDLTRWFLNRPRPPRDVNRRSMNRYAPEQYIWLSFLRKHRSVSCDYQWDLSEEAILGTEMSFAGNLVLVSPQQAGLFLPKYRCSSGLLAWAVGPEATCYTHTLWRHLYEKHCLGRPFTWHSLAWLVAYAAKVISMRPGLRSKSRSAVTNVTKILKGISKLHQREL